MSRPYRLQAENCFYHITTRGNNRKSVFLSDSDRYRFFKYLSRAKEKFSFYLYAYVLMDNHYHFLLETTQANLSRIMHLINSSYATYFSIVHKQSGHLFQGRYKSIVVDKQSYFLNLSAYIHLNPVRAKMVEKPGDYKWSSYNGYVNKTSDPYIDKDKISDILGSSLDSYANFVAGFAGNKDTLFDKLYAGFILGNTKFIKNNLKALRTQNSSYSKEISFTNELNDSISPEIITNTINMIYQKHPRRFITTKHRKIKKQKIVIYLIKRLTPLSNPEIGKMFEIGFSATSKAYISIEREMRLNKRLAKDLNSICSNFEG